ncbi:MAG: glycoside-pentoside-hexuronide (GPH):cation symporter [Deltaproteobacteria bacterium]|nr:glycoside-pentoside-hexuronide (GPH):cation symporter [Deltaproteobacteria bacterium]
MSEGAGHGGRLSVAQKAIYGLGDHTINFALASLAFVYPFFLTDVARLPTQWAALVLLAGRAVDAFSDPLMGRISDGVRWRAGRRRPWLLLGMLPFGAAFAALWWNAGPSFAYYASVYVLFALSSTVVAVPYLALIPEMAASYDERTSLNAWRGAWAILGALLAVAALRPLAQALGGGESPDNPAGYQQAGLLAGLFIAVFWPLIYRTTFERPGLRRPPAQRFFRSLQSLAAQANYRRLVALYLLGRIAIDLAAAMFLYYFTWWLGRPEDFELTLGLFLLSVAASMPLWNAAARRVEKRSIFLMGAASWIASQGFLFLAQPEWPRAAILAGALIGGVGYAAADMIPWSMLGEVVDEDELRSGERREGIYFGLFTFLRKLGGSAAAALALLLLGLSGYEAGADSQSEFTRQTIRVLTAVLPALFVLLAALAARRYGLSRARHAQIVREVAERAERLSR